MNSSKKYIIKITILLIAIVFTNYLVLTNRGTSTSTLDKDTIIVGMELKFPPFETVDESGNPTGVSVDMANVIGEKIGREVEIKNIEYGGLIPALQSGNIDIIISSMSITEERLQSIDFSDEYAKSDLSLAVTKDLEVSGYEDLNSPEVTIAVKQGNLAETWAQKYLPEANIKQFTEVAAGLLDVNTGYSDAFIYDPLSLIEGTSNLSNIKLILDPLPDIQGWGMGIRHGDNEFKEEVNRALQEMKDEGFFDEMREKYLEEEVEKYESYGLDYFF